MPGRLRIGYDIFHRFSTDLIIALLLALCSAAPKMAGAETATDAEMEIVCRNWLSYMIYEQGDWAGESNPTIVDAQDFKAGERLLARCFSISPSGHVIVPVIKELPPIKAYSEDYGIDVNQRVGYPQLLREILDDRLNLYVDFYGSLAAPQPSTGIVLLGREHREEWDRFLVDPVQFASRLGNDGAAPMTEVGPLLTSAWHQNAPYNNDCPMGDGGQCVVGCVATATSQVMKYWEWPPSGLGEHQYYWDGDQSCGGTTAGEWLYADFSDPYDWANMPNSCAGGCTPLQEAAVAELNYEVAVAFEMSFGRCGSSANTNDSVVLMPQYFRYDDSIEWQYRTSHNADSWFGIIQEEINNGRPMLYSFRYSATEGHAIVCDGWRDTGGTNQYHMNYGWGGSYNGWYTIDNIYHDYDYTQDTLIRYIMPGSAYVFEVKPDGSGDYATIQAAIDAVIDGDIIELANGTYTGDGNRDIDFRGKAVTVRSAGGNPGLCIIDCMGDPDNHRGFMFFSGETSASAIRGLTIRNAYQTGERNGAGIFCAGGSSPTIQDCVIEQCDAVDTGGGGNGGGLACIDSDPMLIDCTFYGNVAADASDNGGGIYCSGASPTLAGCIFSGNSAGNYGGAIAAVSGSNPILLNCTFNENAGGGGGAIWISTDSSVDIDNTIIAFGTGGGAIGC